jgi:hypothetical protein
MMAFEQALTTGEHTHGGVSPERLRLLAKQASANYARGGTSLTDAVADVLRDQQGLGPEHVRRVTEFANTYAFDDAFSKEAGDHRVVNFDSGPADPSGVMKELRLDPTPMTSGPSFAQPTGYVPGEDGIEAMFGGHQKTASQMMRSQDYPYENPHGKVIKLWEDLTAARDKIASELSLLENSYNTTVSHLYKEARQVLSEGHSPADVSSVVASASPHPSFVKLALKLISKRMEANGIPAYANTIKVASARLANSQHPLFRATQEFVKVAEARFTHVAALEQVNEQLDVVRRRLKEVLQ